MLAPSSLPPQLLGGGEHQATRWDAAPQSYGKLTADPGINKGSVAAHTRTVKKKMKTLSRQSSIVRKSRRKPNLKEKLTEHELLKQASCSRGAGDDGAVTGAALWQKQKQNTFTDASEAH